MLAPTCDVEEGGPRGLIVRIQGPDDFAILYLTPAGFAALEAGLAAFQAFREDRDERAETGPIAVSAVPAEVPA